MGLIERLRRRASPDFASPAEQMPNPVIAPPQATSASAAETGGFAVAEAPLRDLALCVIDVETTGLSPATDRLVELALVRIDVDGRVERELHTLIDPEGPVEATFVHGITDADVLGAPRFVDLVAELPEFLDDAVVVAHNAAFDTRFLRAELDRSGFRIEPLPYVCSMRLRRHVGLPGPSAHKLRWACWQEGIPVERAHAAICDARATGALISRYLSYALECGHVRLGDIGAKGVASETWLESAPRLFRPAGNGRCVLRCRNGVTPTPASLHRHVPAHEDACRAYELNLAAAAEDFEIDEEEVEDLHYLVTELGLTSGQVRAAHLAHLQRLLDDRIADGLLTWAEQQEVRAFARLLGVPARTVDHLLEQAAASARVEGKPAPGETIGSGLSVCFTGEFVAIPLTREEVNELATDAGMDPVPRVTKKLDLLVCLDPGTGTSKLQKAAEYGTVVIDQQTFLALAGVQPAPEGVVSGVFARLATRRDAQIAAAERKQERSARHAQPRAGDGSLARPVAGGAEQVLWCAAGQHEWSRPAKRGRPPKTCPAHAERTPATASSA